MKSGLGKAKDSGQCTRCGTCCRKGGPALHLEDGSLIEAGTLSSCELVTIRQGEPAYDPVNDKVAPSKFEFVKIRGKGNSWSCRFFEECGSGCLIYKDRPLECRLLYCRAPEPLTKVIGEKLLTRYSVISEDDSVLPLLKRHGQEWSYDSVADLLDEENFSPEEVVGLLTEPILKDLAVREDFLRNFPERHDEELFLFGRPLFLVLAPYGFRLIEDEKGIKLKFVGA